MNHVTGYARPVPMGYWAMVRFDRDSKPNPVKGKGGKPIVFETEAQALREVVTHLCAYFSSPMFRNGEVIVASVADAAFPGLKPFVKQRGKGRRVTVERKGGAA